MYTPPGLKFFLNMNTIDSLPFMFSPIYPASLPTYIFSLPNTVKRKPLIFNFKWNFGWILGQHGQFGYWLCTLPPPTPIRTFFLYPKLDLSWQIPPPPGLKKKSQKMKCPFLDYIKHLLIGHVIQVTKVNQNAKKEMLIFGLCSTSDIGQVI